MSDKNHVVVEISGSVDGYKASTEEALARQQEFRERFQKREAEWRRQEEEADRKWAAFQKKMYQDTSASQAEVSKEAERFVQKLKDQAATLGLSGTQIERYRAAQMQLTAEQRRSVDASLAQIDAFEKQQISMTRMTAIATRLSAVLGAMAVTGGVLAIRSAMQAERSEARMGAVYGATGGTAGYSRNELEQMVQDMARSTVHKDDEVRDAMSRLMTYRAVSGETFREAMSLSAALAEVMGGSMASAAETLGRALEDPTRGLQALTRAGIVFSPQQQELIRDYMEHGRRAEAVAIVLQKLRESLRNVETEVNTGYTKAIGDATEEIGKLFESMGKADAVKGPVTYVLTNFVTNVRQLKTALEGDTWWERYLVLFGGSARPRQPAADPGAAAARERAREHQWQLDFDRQQAGLNAWVKKQEEDLAKESAARAQRVRRAGLHAAWTGEPEFVASTPAATQAAIERQRELAEEAYAKYMARLADGTAGEEENLATRIDPLNDPAVAMRKQAEAVKDAVDPYREYFREVERLQKLQRAGLITQEEYTRAVVMAGSKMKTVGEETAKARQDFSELIEAVEGTGRRTSNALAEMAVSGRISLESLGAAARSFAQEMIAAGIQKGFIGPLVRGLTNWMTSDVSAPGSSSVDEAGFSNVDWASEQHAGGIVGTGRRRAVPSALLAGARRYHRGGLALRPNEVPAVLESGEEVLTRRDPRHRWNGGGMPKVVLNVTTNTTKPVEAKASQPRMDDSGAILVDLFISELDKNAGARDRLRAQVSNAPANY